MKAWPILLIMLFYVANVSSLELYARPKKAHYLPGERVEVVVTIENNASARVAVPLAFKQPSYNLLFIFSQEQEPRDFRKVWCRCLGASELDILWLYPGGRFVVMIDLNYDYDIPYGEYEVYAVYDTQYSEECHVTCTKHPAFREGLWTGRMKSESFTLRIGD